MDDLTEYRDILKQSVCMSFSVQGYIDRVLGNLRLNCQNEKMTFRKVLKSFRKNQKDLFNCLSLTNIKKIFTELSGQEYNNIIPNKQILYKFLKSEKAHLLTHATFSIIKKLPQDGCRCTTPFTHCLTFSSCNLTAKTMKIYKKIKAKY